MSKSTLRRLGKTMSDGAALEFLTDNFPCVANLLRVARAARVLGWPFPQIEQQNELEEALKEVEHLL